MSRVLLATLVSLLILGSLLSGCTGTSGEEVLQERIDQEFADAVGEKKQEAINTFATAESLFAVKKYSEAAIYYQMSADALPTLSAHLNTAIAYKFAGDYEKAEGAAKAGLALAETRSATATEADRVMANHLRDLLSILQEKMSEEPSDTSEVSTEIQDAEDASGSRQERIVELNGETRRAEYSMGGVDWSTYHGKVRYVISGVAYRLDPGDRHADPLSFKMEYEPGDDPSKDPLVIWLKVDIEPLIGKSYQIDPEYPNGWIYLTPMNLSTLAHSRDGTGTETVVIDTGVLSPDMVDREMTEKERRWTLNTARSLVEQLRTD